MPLKNRKMIDYIEKNLGHISIPENIKNRMEGAGLEEGSK